ncbi:MAG: condensation domain-containing protein, partial [Balneolaceae bacterium]
MHIDSIIRELSDIGAKIQVFDDEVRISLKEATLPEHLKEKIRDNKDSIIEFVRNMQADKRIELAPAKEFYYASSAQIRLYFIHKLDNKSLAYNLPLFLKIKGKIDGNKVEQIFNQLIERHESLRTSFEEVDDRVIQRISSEWMITLSRFEGIESEVQSHIRNFIKPFDLRQGPMIRVGLVNFGDEDHLLMVDMHHIITDGVSQSILIRDFVALYLDEGIPNQVFQFKDYVEWIQKEKQQERIAIQEKFWLEKFSEPIKVLQLPTDYPRPAIKKGSGRFIDFHLTKFDFDCLKRLGESKKATTFMTVLSLFNILLRKLSNQDDIVVGTPVAGRDHDDLKHVVGMFVNTLPLRNRPKNDLSFEGFLSTVREDTISFFENQSYQFEDLIENLSVTRDMSRNPLFDVMFVFQHFGEDKLKIPGLVFESYLWEREVAKFDLTLSAVESSERLNLGFEYSTELFSEDTILRFISYFKRIIDVVIRNPKILLSQIEILPSKEKYRLLHEFNETETNFIEGKTVIDLFEDQLVRTPDRTALIFEGIEVSYKEFACKMNQIALSLREIGVVKGTVVAIAIERSIELIVSIYAILKLGASYLPIDPNYPERRINHILTDSNAGFLVTSNKFREKVKSRIKIFILDTKIKFSQNLDPVENKSELDGLAYVIYTSGSTGNPKGVTIKHSSIVNLIQFLNEKYETGHEDRWLLKTNYMFDVSVTEIFGWFLNGGALVILSPGNESDTKEIIKWVYKGGVTHINFVPSMFKAFIDELKINECEYFENLRYIFLAGEDLPRYLVKDFEIFSEGMLLENIYGPTEGTVYSTSFSTSNLRSLTKVPIGKPISNTKCYILGNGDELVPIGVPGELCISGAGLAEGYLNNESLTR